MFFLVAEDEGDDVKMEQLKDRALKIERLIREKSAATERDSSTVGVSFNEKVRRAALRTSGDDYYEQQQLQQKQSVSWEESDTKCGLT